MRTVGEGGKQRRTDSEAAEGGRVSGHSPCDGSAAGLPLPQSKADGGPKDTVQARSCTDLTASF